MIEGQDGTNWDRWKRILQAAEDFGFQCVFRSDHYTNADPPEKDSLELWTSLTYAASNTRRIEFGPLVTPVTFRHPSMTVRNAAAVDDLSGGRLVLGMGAGWQDREHLIFGVPFFNFSTRFDMLEEALQMTQMLFNSDEPVKFNGEHFWLDEAVLLPRPKRAGGPPILIGGKGPKRTMPLIAKYASEWNGVFMDHALYKERTTLLDELLKKEGRQPADVKRSLMTRAEYGSDEADHKARLANYPQSPEELAGHGYIVGRGQEFVDQIAAWADLGVERFMLQWIDQDNIAGLEAMAKDVLPHFHN
jgi:F420-dependent oxidoreductase-like protein